VAPLLAPALSRLRGGLVRVLDVHFRPLQSVAEPLPVSRLEGPDHQEGRGRRPHDPLDAPERATAPVDYLDAFSETPRALDPHNELALRARYNRRSLQRAFGLASLDGFEIRWPDPPARAFI
jgi:hypothetical protein